MKFSVILLSLFSLTLARSDQTATILKDIGAVSHDTVKLNHTLNTFGDNVKSIPVQTLVALYDEVNQLATDMNKTTKATNLSTPFTSADSGKIATSIKSYQPVIISTIQNIVAHKKAIANSGVTGQVETGLEEARELARELTNSLVNKATANYKRSIRKIGSAILAKFDAAITDVAS